MNCDTDMIRGSGCLIRDLGHSDADREQLRALLAARIIGVLDERGLTVHQAPANYVALVNRRTWRQRVGRMSKQYRKYMTASGDRVDTLGPDQHEQFERRPARPFHPTLPVSHKVRFAPQALKGRGRI
jgi:hypothetical protein